VAFLALAEMDRRHSDWTAMNGKLLERSAPLSIAWLKKLGSVAVR